MYTHLHHDFAAKTRANLEFIEKACMEGIPGTYNATQLINSLLGMVVFLNEGKLVPAIPFSQLCSCEEIQVHLDDNQDCSKADKFIQQFRNAIAHCRFQAFGSKDNIQSFTMYDQRPKEPIDWKIDITTQGIRDIAFRLVAYVIKNSQSCEAA
ncbi:HEPN family nuclease [Solidesulfovibrio magneticus]|uniref:pEK499-p136 HEPN domain-containing protein n=1 Tax=Solidesulfovibrio magneticus (strain ATCC 700980 / DSM 13731 / RS-1) TaxID=573370 RepID=C4XLG5_SOLM1|nr:HEPN family nuclease [Solidesulfovibrio magneticus]BAH77104.1 hypothetical protein DMR_36130 [Solidesulfovibrio magneticus RS-1]